MKRFWIFAAAISGAVVSNAAAPTGECPSGGSEGRRLSGLPWREWQQLQSRMAESRRSRRRYIVEQLQNFKDGKRNNPIMMPMAAPLSAQDMADLGAYFDTLTNTGLEADPSYWQAGEKLYRGGDKARGIPACMACHGPTGRGNEPAKFPALRGEQSVYIAKQLNNYATGARPPVPAGSCR